MLAKRAEGKPRKRRQQAEEQAEAEDNRQLSAEFKQAAFAGKRVTTIGEKRTKQIDSFGGDAACDQRSLRGQPAAAIVRGILAVCSRGVKAFNGT